MRTLFRRLFARSAEDEAQNIRESIQRDNLRGIYSDPPFLRGYMSDFERQQRRRHIISSTVESVDKA